MGSTQFIQAYVTGRRESVFRVTEFRVTELKWEGFAGTIALAII